MITRHTALITAILFAALFSACTDIAIEQQDSSGDVNDLNHYVVRGNGEPVVLVHGFSQTQEMWLQVPLYEELIRDYKVIAVDLRGHGKSPKPHNPKAYGPNLQSDLVKVLDHIGIDKAHFIGFSLGASVIGDLVVASPDRVRTATMGSGFFTTWDEKEEDFAEFTENREATGERYPWEPENQDLQALAALIRGARYSSVTSRQIAAIGTPTMIAFGSAEVEHMTESQRRRLRDLPSSIGVMIIDGADYDSEKAAILSQEFTRAAMEFIASNSIP